ncbi:MAG: cadherin-like beta sandwich domain-containing protein [Bacilli bacterium]|nr:cadherin-like beta sandwich domain-containing protein [Bacilli bacterium]
MKRNIVSILLLLFILIPFKVKAISIQEAKINGPEEVKIGEEIVLTFNINFANHNAQNTNELGLMLVTYELLFDDEDLIVTSVTSSDWDSEVYQEEGKYYIISQIADNPTSQNKCSDYILHCGNYEVNVKFFAKNTESSVTNVGVKDVEAGLLIVPNPGEEYNFENPSLITGSVYDVKTIKINKTENQVVKEPENIVSDNKPVNKQPEVVTPNNPDPQVEKSSNNYLSALTIEGYEIDFNKQKYNYNIKIDDNVNTLDVKLELEDSKASYIVTGADDLEKNNYKVKIEVTAENGEKVIYTINAKRSKVEEDVTNKKESFHLDKKYIIFGCIGLGIILIIITIAVIINKINDRKLNKALDELDKM